MPEPRLSRRFFRPAPAAVIACILLVVLPWGAPAGAAPEPAPDVEFMGLDGAPVALSDLRGRVLLINFWGTWCEPCLEEIPELIRLQGRYDRKTFKVVGVAVESGRPEDIRAFMEEHRMDYRVLIGNLGEVKRRFRVLGFPTSILVDSEGMIRKRYFGPQTEDAFRSDLEALIQNAE